LKIVAAAAGAAALAVCSSLKEESDSDILKLCDFSDKD
jgi:hypothetical protein